MFNFGTYGGVFLILTSPALQTRYLLYSSGKPSGPASVSIHPFRTAGGNKGLESLHPFLIVINKTRREQLV